MAPRSPALTARLVQVAQAAAAAPHGSKEAVYATACHELALSRATLLRALKEVTVTDERKRRSDAGETALRREEAVLISAYVMEGIRKNAKRNISIAQAVDVLRRNGEIRAEGVDADGVIRPLSITTIIRALRAYQLHPDQLLRPAPAVEMRSLHPNHCWQIDASICVLFYLNTRAEKEAGLRVMRAAEFEKNKPGNLKRIERDRVWRYVATDHYTGAIQVHYVLGAESGANLAESFIRFIQPKPKAPIQGVPLMVYVDQGSANTAGSTKNLMRRLGVRLEWHAPEASRATGQVEKAQDIVECSFESSLRLVPVHGLAELQAAADRWALWFNGTQKHSRHGQTRFALWQTITAEQLRLAPSEVVCRQLVTAAPEDRKVNDFRQVEFDGQRWDVSGVPRVMVGEKLAMARDPYNPAQIYAVEPGEDGNEVLHACPLVARDAAGFAVTANVIGEDYRRPSATVADLHRTEVDLLATGAATPAESEAARKARDFVPFAGRIDPWAGRDAEADALAYMPRKGTAVQASASVAEPAAQAPKLPATRPPVDERPLNAFEVARALVLRGVEMNPERNALIAQWHPQGVTESALDALAERLQRPAAPVLRLVNGAN